MPVILSLTSFLGSRGVRLPAKPLFCSQHVARFGCATAAGTLYIAGTGGFSRLRLRTSRLLTKAKTSKDFGHPRRRVTDILLIINAITFAAQLLSQQRLTAWGAKNNAAIASGQLWRLITPTFLHANVIHLLLNSTALNNLGPLVEAVSLPGRFLAVYTVAAVAAVTASYLGSPSVSLGASGAIFGIGGALAVFLYRHRELVGQGSDTMLKHLGMNLFMNVVYGVVVARNIDNWGHMGGLIGGALAAYLLGPNFVSIRPPGFKHDILLDRPPLPWFRVRSTRSPSAKA